MFFCVLESNYLLRDACIKAVSPFFILIMRQPLCRQPSLSVCLILGQSLWSIGAHLQQEGSGFVLLWLKGERKGNVSVEHEQNRDWSMNNVCFCLKQAIGDSHFLMSINLCGPCQARCWRVGPPMAVSRKLSWRSRRRRKRRRRRRRCAATRPAMLSRVPPSWRKMKRTMMM